jgi:hypothetical protein
MSVEQVITELQKFPPEFEVKALLDGRNRKREDCDNTAVGFKRLVSWNQEPAVKAVYLELEGRVV